MTMRVTISAATLLLGLGGLSACSEEPAAPEASVDDGRMAEGEVLGGTISDDMIALDNLRSQSPTGGAAASDASVSGATSSRSDAPSEAQDDTASEAAVASPPEPTAPPPSVEPASEAAPPAPVDLLPPAPPEADDAG